MVPENDWFSSRVILSLYCGMLRPLPIFGLVNHGWNLKPESIGKNTRGLIPIFLSNSSTVEECKALGLRNIQVISSPFLYLVKTIWPHNVYPEGVGSIVFPDLSGGHELELSKLLIHETQKLFPPPYTVCLRFSDMGLASKDIWINSGWRVITMGARGNPIFLIKLLQELASHRNILSNVFQTAQVYGTCLGKNIQILNKDFKLSKSRSYFDYQIELRQKYSKIYEVGISGEEAITFGRNELAWDYLLSPAELAHKLGWNSWLKTCLAKIFAIFLDIKYGKNLRQGYYPFEIKQDVGNRKK